jgi:putative ABC transport system substrate-binding protein
MQVIGLAVVLTLGLFVAPLRADAQATTRPARIGFLAASGNPESTQAFRRGLHELGYVEGRNIVTEIRSAEGKPERLPALAAELIALKVDVIVAAGGMSAALAAKQATKTIPIVPSSTYRTR